MLWGPLSDSAEWSPLGRKLTRKSWLHTCDPVQFSTSPGGVPSWPVPVAAVSRPPDQRRGAGTPPPAQGPRLGNEPGSRARTQSTARGPWPAPAAGQRPPDHARRGGPGRPSQWAGGARRTRAGGRAWGGRPGAHAAGPYRRLHRLPDGK